MAWLSLDQSDNHPATFWTYVITALQRVWPEVGRSALSLLRLPKPPPIETLLAMVLNEVDAIPQDLVLVLDDYHLIDAGPIHEGIVFLLDHLPAQMHLVIASRADPMMPLARLRGRGELAEIRAADLRFTLDEAAAFLNGAMGLDLSAQNVAALEARTEGWIAALQLAALSLRGRDDASGFITAFTGDDRYIVDYLVEEVLQRQTEPVRAFLLQTSILNRLHAPLCDAVNGQVSGRAMIESLERGNLFVVPLDDRRQWYRYHQLFADVLQAHLLAEQPDQITVLHGRASAWFEQNAQPSDAIRHALAANDLARAAGLVELEAQAAVRAHQPDRLIAWLTPIPDDLIRAMPVLSTYYAMALQGVGALEASASRLRDAEWWLDDAADEMERPTATSGAMVVVDQGALQSLPSRIALARGYLTMSAGDVAGTVAQAHRALNLLPADEHHWHGAASALLALAHWASGDLAAAGPLHTAGVASFERAGDIVLAFSAAYHDADLLKARGRLAEAGRRYERSLQLATRYGDPAPPGVASLHFGLSDLCCEHDDLEGAAQHLQRGEALGDSAALPRTAYRRCLAQARLHQAQGDLDGAIDLLDQAERLFVPSPTPFIRPIAAWKVRLRLAQGKLAEALDWTRAQGLSVEDDADYAREYQHITLARVLIAQAAEGGEDRSIHAVGDLLDRLRQAAEAGGRTGAVIEVLVLQAIAQRALGDIPASLVQLERALILAEPERYVRLFVEEGSPMRDLLRHASAAGIGGDYARRLLAACEGHTGRAVAAPRATVAGLLEPLTPREVEILRLVAAGMRNQAIADHLVISLSTVKRHIANTYGKLDVEHRSAALARATDLRLL